MAKKKIWLQLNGWDWKLRSSSEHVRYDDDDDYYYNDDDDDEYDNDVDDVYDVVDDANDDDAIECSSQCELISVVIQTSNDCIS